MNAEKYLDRKYNVQHNKNFLKLLFIQLIIPFVSLIYFTEHKEIKSVMIIVLILISNLLTNNWYRINYNKINKRFNKSGELY